MCRERRNLKDRDRLNDAGEAEEGFQKMTGVWTKA